MSYLFAFPYCSWGSPGKNTGMACLFLLKWTAFCQNSSLWSVCLGWPSTACLIASLSYTSPFAVTRLWPMKGSTYLGEQYGRRLGDLSWMNVFWANMFYILLYFFLFDSVVPRLIAIWWEGSIKFLESLLAEPSIISLIESPFKWFHWGLISLYGFFEYNI